MKLSAKIAAIEYAGDDVRVAVVKTGGRRPELLQGIVRRAVYDDEAHRQDALSQATRDAVYELHAHPNAFVLCADSRNCVVRSIMIPLRGRGKVASAVQFELEPFLAFPIEELVVDHSIIREVEGQTEVLAVGMRKTAVEEQLTLTRSAGVDPEGVGIDAAGLVGLYLLHVGNVKGLHAYLHVREGGGVLALLDGRTLLFFRHVSVEPATFRNDPASGAREVSNFIRAFLSTWPTDKPLLSLSVSGIEAGVEPESLARLEEHLGVPVQSIALMDKVKGVQRSQSGKKKLPARGAETSGEVRSEPVEIGPDAACLASAAGVALGAAGGGPAFDFRKGELAQRAPWRVVLAHGVFTLFLLLCLAAVGIGYGFIDYRSNQRALDNAGKQIWELYKNSFPDSELAKGERPAQDVGGILTMQAFQEQYEAYQKIGAGFDPQLLLRPTLLDLLEDISKRMSAEKVALTDLIIRASREKSQQVTIIGELKDPVAGRQEIEKLRESPLLTITGEPLVTTNQDGKTTFTVTAKT